MFAKRLPIAGVGITIVLFVLTTYDLNRAHPIVPIINSLSALPGFLGLVSQETLQTSFLLERRPLASPVPILLAPRDDLCRRPDPRVEIGPNGWPLLVVFVKWPVSDAKGRQLFRDRWDIIGATQAIPRVFLLGKGTNPEMETAIADEQKRWGDLLVFDINDDYYTLTAKTSGFLQWHRNFCSKASYVVRLDGTDTPVNFFYLRRLLRKRIAAGGESIERSVFGDCLDRTGPMRYGRWNMPRTRWPFTSYPIYPNGPFTLLTGEAAAILGDIRLGLTDDELMFDDVQVGMLGLVAGIRGCVNLEGAGRAGLYRNIQAITALPCDRFISLHKLYPTPQEFDRLVEYFRRCDTETVGWVVSNWKRS